MTGSSSTKRKHGFSVGIAPQPKSILAIARAHGQEIKRKIAEDKRAEARLVFYANLKRELNDNTIDIFTISQKYISDLAKLKKKTKVPESKARILAEKNLAKRRRYDRTLKTNIENALPKVLGTNALYQKLYSKRNVKKPPDNLRVLINIYFYLYKEMTPYTLQINIYDFIAAMEDTILNFHANQDD